MQLCHLSASFTNSCNCTITVIFLYYSICNNKIHDLKNIKDSNTGIFNNKGNWTKITLDSENNTQHKPSVVGRVFFVGDGVSGLHCFWALRVCFHVIRCFLKSDKCAFNFTLQQVHQALSGWPGTGAIQSETYVYHAKQSWCAHCNAQSHSVWTPLELRQVTICG